MVEFVEGPRVTGGSCHPAGRGRRTERALGHAHPGI